MTVKNYVLDINKTSLQHPSIVLRQDDYNIYTVNISVTENGVPVNLGSYTLNFLGITPAGAKIIDSKNFITTPADLAVGKFSYRFPKEAAGSKGVYDVAYFRLKTTSGATSTIDLNLRVLGGIDLTADEVKDYITVDDTLRNTLVAEVFKKVDAKVDEHLATVVKGDKGDKGDPGKDGYMPVIGGRNYVLNSSGLNGSSTIRPVLMGSTSGANTTVTYPSDGVLMTNYEANTSKEWYYQVATAWTNFSDTPLTSEKPITLSVDVMGTVPQVAIRYGFSGETGKNENYKSFDINNASWTRVNITATPTPTSTAFYFRIQGGNNNQYMNGWSGGETLKFRYVKIEEGNVATDWTPAPEDIDSAIAKAPKLNGNNMYVGDNTYMGTNTFMDGVTLSGKNVVNNIKDTDWLNIPLPEGITGTAQYKVTMGRVAIHLYGIKGITAVGNTSQGKICTLPAYPCPTSTRYTSQVFNSKLFFRQITILTNGDIYVSNDMGTPMSGNDSYMLDTVLI